MPGLSGSVLVSPTHVNLTRNAQTVVTRTRLRDRFDGDMTDRALDLMIPTRPAGHNGGPALHETVTCPVPAQPVTTATKI
jgi:hypothetical protein